LKLGKIAGILVDVQRILTIGESSKADLNTGIISCIRAKPSKGGDAKLKGLKWQPATEREFLYPKIVKLHKYNIN